MEYRHIFGNTYKNPDKNNSYNFVNDIDNCITS